jgi:hypothetical protein
MVRKHLSEGVASSRQLEEEKGEELWAEGGR